MFYVTVEPNAYNIYIYVNVRDDEFQTLAPRQNQNNDTSLESPGAFADHQRPQFRNTSYGRGALLLLFAFWAWWLDEKKWLAYLTQ